jgi:LCP family protein required for cell wall assembly
MKEKTKTRNKKSNAYKRRRRRRIIFALEIFILIMAAGALFVMMKLGKLNNTKDFDLNPDDIKINKELEDNEVLSGYTNIAVFGVDARYGELAENTRTDMIMVASINNKTKEVKLVSVFRDTYLDTKDGEYRKATEAYALGGVKRAVNMLNQNLDLDIKDYITVDFNAVAEVVDLLGGIDLDITEEELVHINNYGQETSVVTGKEYEALPEAGNVHLNGVQAVSYCRIRYTDGGDYKRAERQREVIQLLVDKAKSADLIKINKIIDKVFPMVYTSFNSGEIIKLASGLLSYEIGESAGFPFDRTTKGMGKEKGDCVIAVNLESNVVQLHTLLFGNDGYKPSAKVKELSQQIIADTGIE